MTKPYLAVFAGVNGAGKSTLYRSGIWQTAHTPNKLARVNADECLREFGGDPANAKDQAKAGKICVASIASNLESGCSFSLETTLAGLSSMQHIRKAKKLGFHTELFFVGIENPELAQSRIRHRVQMGGHDIDDALVEKRFSRSIAHLAQTISLCDQVIVFDNTYRFRQIMAWENNALCWWGASRSCGSWLVDAMTDGTAWQRS